MSSSEVNDFSSLEHNLVNPEEKLFNEMNDDKSSDENREMYKDFEWQSSGSAFKDYLHFCGPGWLVSIAYSDPGNYQANILSGAGSQYNLVWTLWWTTVLSIFVQILCARLAILSQKTLAEIQRANFPRWFNFLCWVIAEISVVITDVPEVIGFAVSLNIFFKLPYYVGILISPVTTMLFLMTQEIASMRLIEFCIFLFVLVMLVVLWIQVGIIGFDVKEFFEGWVYGFLKPGGHDLLSITGIVGSVVMPHNLYLHTASVLSRPCKRNKSTIDRALFWTTIEPIFPICISFCINLAVISIAVKKAFKNSKINPGLTNFVSFLTFSGGSTLWAIALFASGQSSAVTTTYSGQYIMEGFLNLRLKIWQRAIATRLAALIPCMIVAIIAKPEQLNDLINTINSLLSALLPFALTPLIKFSTSKKYLGDRTPILPLRIIMYVMGFLVYLVNVVGLSINGGGLFGDYMTGTNKIIKINGSTSISILVQTSQSVQMAIINDVLQVFYFFWNVYVIFLPIKTSIDEFNTSLDNILSKKYGIVKVF